MSTGQTPADGGVRRCLCHFVVDESKTGSSYGDETLMLSSGGSGIVRCPVCVRHLLRPAIQRHRQALKDHAAAKKECEKELALNRSRIPELQAESQRLRDKSAALRKECGEMAVKVAQAVLENDTIRETICLDPSPLERQRLDLERLERGLLEGSLIQSIENATKRARFLRFQWARKVFEMHRLQIDPEDIKLTPLQKRRQESQPGQQLQRRARGIAKISGLPLPNAGPELYGVLPPRELQSALRIVATVTSTVARCLGIVLPHRILLTMNTGTSSAGDITDTVTEEDLKERNVGRKEKSVTEFPAKATHHHESSFSTAHSNHPVHSAHKNGGYGATHQTAPQPSVISSSTTSLYSMMDKSYFYNKAKKALAKATGQHSTSTTSSNNAASARSGGAPGSNNSCSSTKTIERSFDASVVAQRLNHATSAILTDVDTTADNSSSKFALSTKAMHQGDDFAIALQLLQNDVITLCIRAGVPVSKLWPAEAMLLNLHELDKFCQQQTSVEY